MQTINGIGTTIYGLAKKQELSGAERKQAVAAGFAPVSYQVVKWFVIFYLPIIPMGTFRVVKEKQGFFASSLPLYRMIQVPWDAAQILRHYAIAYGFIVVLFLWYIKANVDF